MPSDVSQVYIIMLAQCVQRRTVVIFAAAAHTMNE